MYCDNCALCEGQCAHRSPRPLLCSMFLPAWDWKAQFCGVLRCSAVSWDSWDSCTMCGWAMLGCCELINSAGPGIRESASKFSSVKSIKSFSSFSTRTGLSSASSSSSLEEIGEMEMAGTSWSSCSETCRHRMASAGSFVEVHDL